MVITADIGCARCGSHTLEAFEITQNIITLNEEGCAVQDSIGIGMGIQCLICSKYLHGSHYFDFQAGTIKSMLGQEQ